MWDGQRAFFSDQGHFVLAFQYQNGLIWIADPSYTREKYEKECRRDKVRLEGTCVLVTPEALQREGGQPKPGFYIFETRKDRSSMKKVHTDLAPKAIGPYSQAMICGGMVYTSGQIPLDPVSGSVSGEEIQSQSRQVLENLKAVLEAAGSGMDKVVKTTCFPGGYAGLCSLQPDLRGVFSPLPVQILLCGQRAPQAGVGRGGGGCGPDRRLRNVRAESQEIQAEWRSESCAILYFLRKISSTIWYTAETVCVLFAMPLGGKKDWTASSGREY